MKTIVIASLLLTACASAFAQQAAVKKDSSDTTKIKLVCVQEIGKEQPQYIVDGIEVCPEDIAKIDPRQIESIQVLKGTVDNRPDGGRKKNGVILIEMKKATREQPKDKLK
jgi:hypothetical protein